jgi:hypothetical protein
MKHNMTKATDNLCLKRTSLISHITKRVSAESVTTASQDNKTKQFMFAADLAEFPHHEAVSR